MRFIILLITFIVVGGLLEWYIYSAISGRWNSWSPLLKQVVKITYWSLLGLSVLSMIMLFGFNNYISRAALNFWFSFIIINFIIMFTFSFFLFIDDLRRLGVFTRNKLVADTVSEAISRSDFLVKTGLVAATIPLAGLSWGMISGPYRYKVFN